MSSLKCLYIHDHTFKNKGNHYYSEGKITDSVFSRYVSSADQIVVFSRMEKRVDVKGLTPILSNNVEFSPVFGLSFSKIFTTHLTKNLNLAIHLIKKSDFIVVRLPSFLGVFILIINIFLNKKYYVELVGDPKEALLNSKENVNFLFKFFTYIFTFLNALFIKRADGVIYVTKYDLQKKYPNYLLQGYASNVEIEVEDKEIDLKKNKNRTNFKIGLIGSFNNTYKAIDDAIKAISLLVQKNYNVSLHILGSGKLKLHYLELAKEMNIEPYIIFDGVLSGGKEVNQWLDSLDIYIQPSRTEGLPRSLIEAMARGLPAIATDVGGIPELLSPRFLIKPNSPRELAMKIQDFIQSESLRNEQSRINYNKAKEYDSKVLKVRREKFWNQARKMVIEELK